MLLSLRVAASRVACSSRARSRSFLPHAVTAASPALRQDFVSLPRRPLSALSSALTSLFDRGCLIDSTAPRDSQDGILETPNTACHSASGPGTLAPAMYIGFDPTAASLHVGNLFQIMLLAHVQQHNARAVALVGGATALLGDPSGRSTERDVLHEETAVSHQNKIEAQLRHLLRIRDEHREQGVTTEITVRNNREWLDRVTALHFFTEVGRVFRVSNMLGKTSVKSRMEQEDGGGMSYAELSYQVFQAYDFYHLYLEENCRVQAGGADQWGNITSGTELIRKKCGNTATLADDANLKAAEMDPDIAAAPTSLAFGVTTDLLVTKSGEKFGKSAGNAVWLDSSMTSNFDFYQFFIRSTDDQVGQLLRALTLLPVSEIDNIMQQHETRGPQHRYAQTRLAEEVTCWVRGRAEMRAAQQASQLLYHAGEVTPDAVRELYHSTDIPHGTLDPNKTDIASVLHQVGAVKSRKEAKRLVTQGGVTVNGEKAAVSGVVVKTTYASISRTGEPCSIAIIGVGKSRKFVVKQGGALE